VYTDPDVPCDEGNSGFVERDVAVPLDQAALVRVDGWSTHYIDSCRERATEVARDRIVPLIYAGFATNWCVIGRDCGIIAMNERVGSSR